MKGLSVTILALLVLGSFGLPRLVKAQSPSDCFWGNFEVLSVPLLGGAGRKDICQLIAESGGGLPAVATVAQELVTVVMALVLMAAAIGVVIGGYLYMTAGGSADRVQLAKSWIIAALLGITIALTSWVVLGTISATLT